MSEASQQTRCKHRAHCLGNLRLSLSPSTVVGPKATRVSKQSRRQRITPEAVRCELKRKPRHQVDAATREREQQLRRLPCLSPSLLTGLTLLAGRLIKCVHLPSACDAGNEGSGMSCGLLINISGISISLASKEQSSVSIASRGMQGRGDLQARSQWCKGLRITKYISPAAFE